MSKMYLDEEKTVFLQILADHINQRKTKIVSINNNVIKYAHLHQVEAIVYHQCKNTSNVEQMKTNYYSQVVLQLSNQQEAICFQNTLKDYPFVFVKGIEVAKMYPFPALRSMGDIDVVVHKEH